MTQSVASSKRLQIEPSDSDGLLPTHSAHHFFTDSLLLLP